MTDAIQTTITLTGFDPSLTAKVWTLTGPSANSSNEINPNTVKPVLVTMENAFQTFTYSFSARFTYVF
jgi:alpha-L-arabinofuranosidase